VTSRPISGRVRMLVRILPVRQFAVRSSQITKPLACDKKVGAQKPESLGV